MAAVIALLVITLLLTNKSEKFVEMFGFSGHSPAKGLNINRPYEGTETSPSDKVVALNNTQMNTIIQAVMKDIGTCVYPLETNRVREIDDSVYRCNFTFMANDGGFPIGVGVQSDVMFKDGKANVMGITTQPLKTSDEIQPFNQSVGTDFQDFEMILNKNIPSADALSEAKNSFAA